MGNVARRLSRPFKNYNIENRAHREIARDKPKVAPSYKMKQTQINLVNEMEPDYKVSSQTKNTELDNNLKKIYVKSYDDPVPNNNRNEDPERALPKERLRPELFEFGFYESGKVVKGKIDLRQAIQMIDKHSKDPIIYNSECLAKEYYLEKKLVDDILEYFFIFKLEKEAENETVTGKEKSILLGNDRKNESGVEKL